MPDPFLNEWGLSPEDLPKAPDLGVGPTKTYDQNQFTQEWGLAESPAPVALPKDTKAVANKLSGTFIGQLAGALTLPGDVKAGKTAVDVTDPNFLGRVTTLGGIVGTGAIPGIVRAGESSIPAVNTLARALRPAERPLIDPESARLAAIAIDKYGIPLHGGQISENRTVNYLDNMLNYGKYGEQRSAFNRAVSNTFGQNAEKLTPDVMLKASKELGANFDTVAANTTSKLDQPLIAGLDKINEDSKFLQPSERGVIGSHINHIIDIAQRNNGEISGSMLQDLLSHKSPLGKATRDPNSNIRQAASQIKSELIDNMGRYAPEEMRKLYTQTKYQYKNMKTIEDLAEKSPTGDISPALLMGAVRKSYNDMAYGGGGDLADLARIGQRFLKEPPQSGTQPRQKAERLMNIGGLVGGGIEAGTAFHDPVLALKLAGMAAAAGAGTALTKSAVSKFLRSEGYTNRLINSALPERRGSVNALQKLVNTGYLPPGAALPVLPFLQPAQ